MSLRGRLLAAVLALVAVALLVAGVATHAALRSFLLDRVDRQLDAAAAPLARSLARPSGPFGGGPIGGRPPIGGGPFGGGPFRGGTTVADIGYAELRGSDGDLIARLVPTIGGDPLPALPSDLGLEGRGARRFSVGSDEGRLRHRVLAVETPRGALVVAAPLDDVATTLRRLVVIELVVAGVVLGLLALLARSAIAVGLRPLDEIGTTAGAIAAGDLSQRVGRADDRTEVGRLGAAINGMLGRIEAAFAERSASEAQLRRFVADASHELRTPLTSIRGYAELFRRGAADRPEDLATAMRRIEEEASRMGVLVDDLLLLARLDQGRPLERAPVDLAAIAADAVADARAVEPDAAIAFDASGPVPVVGDDARLRQVAANLLTNARVHTPAGTGVRVAASLVGGRAVLEVTDEGPGLAPDIAARVFERFYRSDASRSRASGGSGLGLSIVGAIAEAHGGRATVSSTPGAGATFRVELPAAPPS